MSLEQTDFPTEEEVNAFNSLFDNIPKEQEEAPASSSEEKQEEETEPPAPEGGTEDKSDEPKEESTEESKDNAQEEENIPFHMHPRWKAVMQERNELRQQVEEVQKKLQDLATQPSAQANSQTEVKAPDWFVQSFGEDPELWERYNEENKRTRQEIKNEVLQEIRSEQERAQKEQEQTMKWIDDQMEVLGDLHSIDLSPKDGKNSLRNEIIKIALEYQPTDGKGNVDLGKAYEIHKLMHPKENTQSSKRKEVAQTVTTSKQHDEPAKKDYLTSEDLRKMDWSEIPHLN